MKSTALAIFAATVVLLAANADARTQTLSHEQVIKAVAFLEQRPNDETAPALRSLLVDWEDKSRDVVDYVCPEVLAPIPADDVPNSSELLGQFIFGSAAFQLAHPDQKGKLQPGQLAGMRSMLRAYQSMLALDQAARIPRLDELSAKEADGTLPAYLAPVVAAGCDKH